MTPGPAQIRPAAPAPHGAQAALPAPSAVRRAGMPPEIRVCGVIAGRCARGNHGAASALAATA
jgi:hypothetical protein